MIIQQADGKIENSDKRTERWTDGRVEDGIDDCGGGGTFPGRWEWDDATLPSFPFLAPPPVWPVRRQIAMFVSG